jgi:hypothetical protein
MADVITRFKLETTQYDSKLRDTSKGLAEFTRQATQAGNEFGKFTQKNIEAARALGTITPSANNAKDKVKELVGAFNDAAKAYNALTKEQQQSDFGKAMAESISQLSDKIREAKQELYDMGDAAKKSGGGGLFSGLGDKMSGAMQVFAGNMLTKAAGAVANLGSEIFSSVQQGVELAKQGEGIRIAFERLGRGDILDGLRQATHGTVTDLELMKAAVKFNDFKLPLDELGTMLAFAQQKAKDTGQSVDYMVDSIVTGLGRKSLMILDNLGLSATEVKEKMAETGDMTKAVGAIIREQMSKAGDYVETAADRAAKADVELKNAMEELGRTFQPLTDASDSLWNSIKVGALNALNTAVKPLIQALSEAGALGQGARSSAGFNNLGGNSKVDRMIGRLGNGKSAGAYSIYKQQLAEFDKYINNKQFQIAAYGGDNSGVAQSAKAKLQTELDGALKMRAEYVKRAQELSKPVDVKIDTKGAEQNVESLKVKLIELEAQRKKAIAAGDTDLSKNLTKQINQTKADIKGLNPTALKTTPKKTEKVYAEGSIAAQAKLVSDLTKKWNEAGADVRDQYLQPLVEAEAKLKEMQNTMALQKAQAEGKLNGVNLWQGDIDDISGGKTPQFAGSLPDLTKSLQLDNLPQFLSPLQQLNAELEQLRKNLEYAPTTEAYQEGLKAIADKEKEIANFKGIDLSKDADKSAKSFQAAAGAISQVGSALNGIEDPTAKILGIIAQAIASVAAGAGQAVSAKDTTSSGWAWIGAAAAITASMVAMISQIHSATGYAQGGIVDGRGGGFVGGMSYSGDNIGNVRLDSGELVLNRAQQTSLANQLQSSPMSQMQLSAVVTGEQIRLVLNNNGRRTGRGEYVTTNFT